MTGAMGGQDQVQVGMPVYGPGDEELGRVGRLHGDDFDLGNGSQHIPLSAVARVAGDRVYVRGGLDRYQTDAALDRGAATDREAMREDRGEIVVPVVEERLDVEKRPAELGEVTIEKNVTEERREVPVELRREEVHVERRDVADRPVRAGEADLRDETIRVPVRGEEAVVRKEPVVTDEVVIDKTQTTERQTAADTVRKERVDVDKDLDETHRGRMGREDLGTPTTSRAGAAVPPPPATAPERAGATTAGRQPQMGMDVLGSDDAMVGRVKEVRATDFLVDRRMQRDIYVPNDAIRDVARGQVNLNIPAHQVDNMGWANPPLM